MCQILQTAIQLNNESIRRVLIDQKHTIIYLLDDKGGEDYSFTYYFDESNYKTIYCNPNNVEKKFDEFIDKLYELSKKFPDGMVTIVLFSRQAPEMEAQEGSINPAPYVVKNKLIWMHGTVSNQSEIEKYLNVKFTVDSQVFGYWKHLLHNNIIIKGVFATYCIDIESGDSKWLYNGIGLWKASQPVSKIIQTWTGTTPLIKLLTEDEVDEEAIYLDEPPYYLQEKHVNNFNFYVSFSGGMDVVMSTYAVIKKHVLRVSGNIDRAVYFDEAIPSKMKEQLKLKYKLIYFDYGAQARDHEIAAMKKFIEYIKKEIPNIDISYEIIDVKTFFKELSKINEIESKLMNKDARGELAETEDNLAYVPYRNTQFGILLGALIDKDLEKELFNPIIIYGLNLTEMGVYVDNTEVWLKSVQRAIRYGGKNYKDVNIVAPFVNTTKTNMLAFMIKNFGFEKVKELLDIAFSCYYPNKNGEPCGECGSCILRQKALERALKKIKKMKMEVENEQ